MALTDHQLLIEALKRERNKYHSQLGNLVYDALYTTLSSDEEKSNQQKSEFNVKFQRAIHEFEEYSERLGVLLNGTS